MKEEEVSPVYLVVVKVDSKLGVRVTEENTILACKTHEECISLFDDFTRKFKGNYEQSMSATIAMMQIRPFTIKVDSIEQFATYVADKSVLHVDGGISLSNFKCVEVKKEIEELKITDIFGEVLKRSGLKN